MAHAFDHSTRDTEVGGSLKFEVSLVYRISSWTGRATQGNPTPSPPKEGRAYWPLTLFAHVTVDSAANAGNSEIPPTATLALLSSVGLILLDCFSSFPLFDS